MALPTAGDRALELTGKTEVWETEDGVFLTTHDDEVEIIVELTGAARMHVRNALRLHRRNRKGTG